jgi:hypothetical protein
MFSGSPEYTLSLALGALFSLLIYLRIGSVARSSSGQTAAGANDLRDEKKEGAVTVGPSTTPEKRKAKRRRGALVKVLIRDIEEKFPPYDGLVTDRSIGGLTILVSEPVPAGTHLKLRGANSSEMMLWVQAKVKTCTPDGIDWRLGCQFLQSPPSAVMWQFDS